MTIYRHRNPWPIPPVRFNDLVVQEVNALKLLGVTFDKHLNDGQHLRAIALCATQCVGFLRKASRVLGLHGPAVALQGLRPPDDGVLPSRVVQSCSLPSFPSCKGTETRSFADWSWDHC